MEGDENVDLERGSLSTRGTRFLAPTTEAKLHALFALKIPTTADEERASMLLETIQSIEGYQSIRVSLRTLRPFAEIIRDGIVFAVDALVTHAAIPQSSTMNSPKPAPTGDPQLWQLVQRTGIFEDVSKALPFPTVPLRVSRVHPIANSVNNAKVVSLHVGLATGGLRSNVEHAVVDWSPPEGLSPRVSGVLERERHGESSILITGQFFFHVIRLFLDGMDLTRKSLEPLLDTLRMLNKRLNQGALPRRSQVSQVDWLSAAKVLQRSHRRGLLPWAAAIGRAFAQASSLPLSSGIAPIPVRTQRGLWTWSDFLQLATRTLGDVAIRDAHRLIGTIGGSTTAWLGARSESSPALVAGITLALVALALASRPATTGRRCATREILFGSGAAFNSDGGAYGLRYGDTRVSPNGVVSDPLEVGVLEAAGFRFFLDVGSNVMCRLPGGRVVGCLSRGNRVLLDPSLATDPRLLTVPVRLARDSLVG